MNSEAIAFHTALDIQGKPRTRHLDRQSKKETIFVIDCQKPHISKFVCATDCASVREHIRTKYAGKDPYVYNPVTKTFEKA